MTTEFIRAHFKNYSTADGAAAKLKTIRATDIHIFQPDNNQDTKYEGMSLPSFTFIGMGGASFMAGSNMMGPGFSPINAGIPSSFIPAAAALGSDGNLFSGGSSIVLEAVINVEEYDKAKKIIRDGEGRME